MKNPVLITIFYEFPYHENKHPEYFEFEMETKLLVENVPLVGDVFHLEGLFSKEEIKKMQKDWDLDIKTFAVELLLVKDRVFHYKNLQIDCIDLFVTEMEWK